MAVAGLAVGVSASIVGSWVGTGVDVSSKEAGVGVAVAVVVTGLAVGVSASIVGSWVGTGVDVSSKEAGVGVAVAVVVTGVPWGGGVGIMFVGDRAMELGSAVIATAVGIAAGVGVWPEQAARTMRTGRSAPSGSLLIRFMLSF